MKSKLMLAKVLGYGIALGLAMFTVDCLIRCEVGGSK